MRKRILSILSIVILFSWAAMAVPAYSGKMKVRQGDGSWLTITLRGDEYAHVALTIDGIPWLGIRLLLHTNMPNI